MKLKKQNLLNKFSLLFFILLLTSCGPVNYFTRLKKTPNIYTLNYCGEQIQAPKNDFEKETWIVFSDRENNPSYRSPGGKVKMKEFDFMDAFFVIKKKGEYYQLVKYDTAIVEDLYTRKIKKRKQAEYCGWIHESQLLLTRRSMTDISTGFKDKQITILSDTLALSKSGLFLKTDSVLTFHNANLSKASGSIPFYNIVYPLKNSSDKKKVLIAEKSEIVPDSAKNDVLGWISSGLVKTIGQRLHVDLSTLPQDSLLFKFKDKYQKDTLSISSDDLHESKMLNQKEKVLKYNPVFKFNVCDTGFVSLKTTLTIPVIDNSGNHVFNVNGKKISYSEFREIEEELRRLNILFILEGQEKVIRNYAEITNVIQNLQPLTEKENNSYSFKFGAVLTYRDKINPAPVVKTSGLVNDYTALMDFMIDETSSKKQNPISDQYAWTGIGKAVDLLEPHKKETNILVVIGETGYSESVDSALINRIADANCKILGFQMHGAKENAGNNFVLQMANMIEKSSRKIGVSKREKIVYANQVKSRNLFKERGRNTYSLDFPERSMSQGWILFPGKESSLTMDMLSESVDSLINEVISDNEKIIADLYNAFTTVGNHRHQYNSLFSTYNAIDRQKMPSKDFLRKFEEKTAVSYLPGQRINLPDSVGRQTAYSLLLSKEELDETIAFLDELSAIEADYKYKGKKKKREKKCNCPDDEEDVFEMEIMENLSDSTFLPEYQSTRKLRKNLYNLYMELLTTCKLCGTSKKVVKEYSLSEAHRLITGSPSYTPVLEKYKIKDIKKKKQLEDKELDLLIQYFKQKKEDFIMALPEIDKFESGQETYYWVNQNMLP